MVLTVLSEGAPTYQRGPLRLWLFSIEPNYFRVRISPVFTVSAKLPKEKTALAVFHGGRRRRCRGMPVLNAPADFVSCEG